MFVTNARLLFVVIAAVYLAVIHSTDRTHFDNTNYKTEQHTTYYNSTDVSEWLWMKRTKCDSVSYDLPHFNDLFVGRNEEMANIIQLMNTAHIVGIFGAPGFGKSQLAIHVGYEMVKRGTTVRYIDAIDELSHLKAFHTESVTQEPTDTAHKQTKSKQNSMSTSVSDVGSGSLTAFVRDERMNLASDKVLDRLVKWSGEIDCHTLLILDNCDDLVYNKISREVLIKLLRTMIKKSNSHLHIILTSHQHIRLLDDFESMTIKELSMNASVELLLHLSPGIIRSHAEQVALLVEGCPLALKVVGKLMHKRDDTLTNTLEDELRKRPVRVLDKASIQKERFGAIMDVAYNLLSSKLQECGYYLSLFPGSFEDYAGSSILPHSLDSRQCLETYVEHSLLDEYNLAQITLHKMHRLIREYLREKGGLSSKSKYYYRDFEKNYCRYFTNFILQHAKHVKEDNVTEKDQYAYSLQLHNIHHFLSLLLSKDEHLTKERIALAYSVGEGLVSVNSIKNHFHFFISKVQETCYYVKPEKCGDLFSYIITELYQECRCNNIKEYFKQFLTCPCMDLFRCEIVAEIKQNPSISSRLEQPERDFLFRLKTYHCDATFMNTYAFYIPIIQLYIPSILVKIFIYVKIFTSVGNEDILDMVLAHIAILSALIYHTYNLEIMVWLILIFPEFLMHCIRLLLSLVIFIMLLVEPGYGNVYLSVEKIVFVDISIVFSALVEIFLLWRFVPFCF